MSSFIIEQNNSLKIIYNTAFIKDKIDNAIKVPFIADVIIKVLC